MAAVAILLVLGLVMFSYRMVPILLALPNSNNDFAFEFDASGVSRAADIAFYFDFSSPYGYFAAHYIEGLAARHGRRVRWYPILMPVLFKVTGSGPLPPMPVKGPYILRDFERTARLHGIPYRQPRTLPMVSLAPARAMLWVEQTCGEAAAVAFAKRCYRAYFTEDIDICDYRELTGIAESLGLDAAGLEAGAQSETIKRRFVEANEQALARGVFGSPFVIVDGEHFWGFDHLYQVEARLSGRTRLDSFPAGWAHAAPA